MWMSSDGSTRRITSEDRAPHICVANAAHSENLTPASPNHGWAQLFAGMRHHVTKRTLQLPPVVCASAFDMHSRSKIQANRGSCLVAQHISSLPSAWSCGISCKGSPRSPRLAQLHQSSRRSRTAGCAHASDLSTHGHPILPRVSSLTLTHTHRGPSLSFMRLEDRSIQTSPIPAWLSM